MQIIVIIGACLTGANFMQAGDELIDIGTQFTNLQKLNTLFHEGECHLYKIIVIEIAGVVDIDEASLCLRSDSIHPASLLLNAHR